PLVLMACVLNVSSAEELRNGRTITNVVYRENSDKLDDYARQQCQLDLYLPSGVKNFPTIIWFHGGGLTGGQRYLPARLLEQGMAVVAVSYRLSPQVKVVECVDDAAAAVAWVFKNIPQYGGSAQKIIVSGHSAGGYLTSLIGL